MYDVNSYIFNQLHLYLYYFTDFIQILNRLLL